MTSEQASSRVKDAWGTKGHAAAVAILGPGRSHDPFTYEFGAKLVAELEAAAFDPASDLDAIVIAHIESMK